MSIETYGKMGISITKVTAIADWPTNGMSVSSPCVVLIKANDLTASDTVWLQLTYDKYEEIENGTAQWLNYMEIVPGEEDYVDLAYSPYGVNFDFSAVDSGEPVIWVRR